MWLNVLKNRLLKKAIEKSKLKAVPAEFKYEFKSVGILVEKADAKDMAELLSSLEKKGVTKERVHFLVYAKENKWDGTSPVFGMKDFGLSGSMENAEVKEFIQQEFDCLISYCTNPSLSLLWVVSQSHAKFKIGLSADSTALHHFSLPLEQLKADEFVNILFKYINLFKN